MLSSDIDDSDDEEVQVASPPLVLKPLSVLKKITKLRRQVDSTHTWLYQILKKAEKEIEHALSSSLERAHEPIETAPSRQGKAGTSSAAAAVLPSPRTRAPRHPSLSSKRYVWKKEEEDILKGLLQAYTSKNKEVNWNSISRKLRISTDKCKRKAKSLSISGSQIEIESEDHDAQTASAPPPLPAPPPAPAHPRTSQAAIFMPAAMGEKRTRGGQITGDTPLRTQVHRVLQLSGGEGTVDEVVEELLIEPRWMREEGGRAGLRKRVAAVLSSSGGSGHGLFESTTQLRGASHKRIVYRNIG